MTIPCLPGHLSERQKASFSDKSRIDTQTPRGRSCDANRTSQAGQTTQVSFETIGQTLLGMGLGLEPKGRVEW
jgi:hypothetical protein